jgi:hypothetical protein
VDGGGQDMDILVPECTTTLRDLALQPFSEHTSAVELSDGL